MPLARIITDHPEAASTTIRALRESGYIIEIISTHTKPAYRADLVLRADENGLCQPDVHRLQAANVYFADSQTSAVEAPYDSEYEGPYEREFVLAPAWRSFKAKLAELRSHFVREGTQPGSEEFITPTMLHLDAPVERRGASNPAPPVVVVEEEYVPPAYSQAGQLEPLEPPVYQDIAAPVHFESMMPMAPEIPAHTAEPEAAKEFIPEAVFEYAEAEPVFEPAESTQPIYQQETQSASSPAELKAEATGPSRLQEELAAFKQHARGLALSAVAEGKHWWANRAVAAGHARDLVWKRSFAMAGALAVAFLFGFNAASQREIEITPNLDRTEHQVVEPAATPVVPALDRSNPAAARLQKASLNATPAVSVAAQPKAAAKPAARARRAAARDYDKEDVYDEDEDVERYGDDVIVRHYPTKKVIVSAKSSQRGTRKISDMD